MPRPERGRNFHSASPVLQRIISKLQPCFIFSFSNRKSCNKKRESSWQCLYLSLYHETFIHSYPVWSRATKNWCETKRTNRKCNNVSFEHSEVHNNWTENTIKTWNHVRGSTSCRTNMNILPELQWRGLRSRYVWFSQNPELNPTKYMRWYFPPGWLGSNDSNYFQIVFVEN